VEIRLTDDQALFKETTRKFLESETPIAAVRELEANADGFDREWWSRAASLGWTSLLVPEELGGGSLSGQGLLDLVLVSEEMGRLVAPGPLLPVNVVVSALADAGTSEARDEWLPGLLSGECVAAWAFYERGRWDSSGVHMRASGHGPSYVLNGTKTLVEAGTAADVLLVTAKTDDGLLNCVVPATATGVTVRPMESIDLVRRFAGITFEDVVVPATGVVGDLRMAAEHCERLLQIGVVLQCHETNGAISHVFDMTTQYAADRFAFGRTLNSYQALKHRFADMKMWLEGCHGIATHAARAVENHAANAIELVSAAKAHIGERSTDLIQDCVQLHGGIGVTWEHDLHLFLRRAMVNRQVLGTPSEHRERIAAFLAL
jgi:alkylation response protein AidB-like acyl-CoA dehydrogenase